MKVICTTLSQIPTEMPVDTKAFSFFEASALPGVGTISAGWVKELERQGYAPSLPTWDFVLFSFAVCAADLATVRKKSADAWTREIDLTVSVNQSQIWNSNSGLVAKMLRVLTGDIWTVTFTDGGPPPPVASQKPCDRDCVSLLSGGLDSWIGGIDLVAAGRRPVFVSQLAYEDSERQRMYAKELGGSEWHQQWSPKIVFKGRREPSTRARSMAFYGLAVLATTLLDTQSAELYVPENGFISLNPPLLPGRMSSLSTRTTHPLFMKMLQELLTGIGLNVELKMPYRFKTKGEMLADCLDQAQLRKFAADTTSCGRYRTYNRTHCGRCIPCLIRKASFIRWDAAADVTRYKFPSLRNAAKAAADDGMAAACAVLDYERRGINRFLGGSTSFAEGGERADYRRVITAGLTELGALLRRDGIL